MKEPIALEGLSKHRTALMGIAITFIMLCHNTVAVPQSLHHAWRIFSQILQCGVDIFLLLSGLGLFYSFRKRPKVITFWVKRYSKILPPYFIVVLLFGIIWVAWLKRMVLAVYAYRYCLITFYIDGELGLWFISAILMLYAVFPMLYAFLQKYPKAFVSLCIIIAIGSLTMSYLNCPPGLAIINEILVCRIPEFLMGMVIAKAILDGKTPTVSSVYIWLLWIVSTILIIGVFITAPTNYWVIVRLLFLPFTLSGMLLLTTPFDKYGKSKHFYGFFCFLGGITLEIYLLHERILTTVNHFTHGINCPDIILTLGANILAILIAIFGSWLLQRVICSASTFYSRRKCLCRHSNGQNPR